MRHCLDCPGEILEILTEHHEVNSNTKTFCKIFNFRFYCTNKPANIDGILTFLAQYLDGKFDSFFV